eukprot:CAMPEP_0180052592 /NCGR_PEP_ID=MMETSP0985-20121206/1818_1 /TAXON_ID=483367 /ORGANISM="non described non described, Strain CCMP 2436" /LENGTH=48 /DNA_ID= /DNA_START= /DNA_END= /DNA_ORIENTATION=
MTSPVAENASAHDHRPPGTPRVPQLHESQYRVRPNSEDEAIEVAGVVN